MPGPWMEAVVIDTVPVPGLRAHQLSGEADTQEAAAGSQAVDGAVGALGT